VNRYWAAEFPLQSITAAISGGCSLRGGQGGVGATIVGAIFVTVFANSMDLMRLGSNHQNDCSWILSWLPGSHWNERVLT
jgi:ribose/xylose/arabinose/galactoside ABC-type transport system permease subunit